MCTYELGGWISVTHVGGSLQAAPPSSQERSAFHISLSDDMRAVSVHKFVKKIGNEKGSTFINNQQHWYVQLGSVWTLSLTLCILHTVSWLLWLVIIWCPLMSNVKICLVRQHWPRDQDFSPLSWPNLVVEGGVGGEHAGTTDCLKHHKRIVKPDPKT